MPFFEPESPSPAEEPAETERVWLPPRWDRPSEGTLPAVVGVSRLFGRTENAAFALDHLRVYPNGFQLVLSIVTSPRLPPEMHMGSFTTLSLIATSETTPPEKGDAAPPPRSAPVRPRGRGVFEMAPRVGIRFSNGQTAGNGPQSMFDVPKDDDGVPTQPVIVGSGGGGGGGHYRFEHWVFPLPPPGPLEVFAQWPVADIGETSIVLSGDDVRAAGQNAIVLWS